MGWLIRPSLCPALVTCLKETPKKLHFVQMVVKISNPAKGCTFVLKLVARLQSWGRPFIIGEISLYYLVPLIKPYLKEGGTTPCEKGCRNYKADEKNWNNLCEPTQWESHSSCGCPHKIRPPEMFAFWMSEHFGTFSLKKKKFLLSKIAEKMLFLQIIKLLVSLVTLW